MKKANAILASALAVTLSVSTVAQSLQNTPASSSQPADAAAVATQPLASSDAAHITGAPDAADPTRDPVLADLGLPTAVVTSIVTETAARLPTFVSVGSTAQQPR